MKILLIRYLDKGNINTRLPDAVNKAQGIYPPLGIAYIGAALEKAGYHVKILDAQALNLTSSDCKKIIFNQKADIVGITCMTSNFHGVLEAARFAKQAGSIVVIGGPQLSAYPKESVSYDFIDFGIIGEAEESMVKLAEAIKNKKNYENIPGLIYKKKGEINQNSPAIIKNLDKLPPPAFNLLPVSKYDCVITEKPVLTMITSRGCPFKCGFCFKQPTDKFFRKRNPKKVVDEIEDLIKKYNVKEIMFYDDTLTLDREHIMNMCNEILKRGIKIKWQAPTRINSVDRELLKLMKKAGCTMLRYGVESGDENILKIMKKGTTLEKIKQVFKLSKEIGIETFSYFIIGYVGETPATMNNTIQFAKEIDPDMAMFTVATPYPKTDLYRLAEKAGLVKGDYWRDFTLGEKNKRMGYMVKDADKWTKKAYRSFYLRPRFILKRLRKMTSIDAIKKNLIGARAVLNAE